LASTPNQKNKNKNKRQPNNQTTKLSGCSLYLLVWPCFTFAQTSKNKNKNNNKQLNELMLVLVFCLLVYGFTLDFVVKKKKKLS